MYVVTARHLGIHDVKEVCRVLRTTTTLTILDLGGKDDMMVEREESKTAATLELGQEVTLDSRV